MSAQAMGRTKSAALPILLRPRAVLRFLFDRRAPLAPKLFFAAALAYLALPLDAIPDVLPVIGWLDDVGALAAAFGWFLSAVKRYEDQRDVIDVPAK